MEILHSVKGKPPIGIQIAGWAVFAWGMANLALFLYTGSKGIVFLWFFLIIVVIWFFVFFRMRVDYDYLYNPNVGNLQVARVTNKSRRRLILDTDLDEMDLLAPENSHAIDRYRQDTSYKYIDYSFRPKKDTCYLLFCNGKKQKICLRFAPSEKMLRAVRDRLSKSGQGEKVVIQ